MKQKNFGEFEVSFGYMVSYPPAWAICEILSQNKNDKVDLEEVTIIG